MHGHIFFSLKTHKVDVFRHINCNENLFPYHYDYDANLQYNDISLPNPTNDCFFNDIDVNNQFLPPENNISYHTMHIDSKTDITKMIYSHSKVRTYSEDFHDVVSYISSNVDPKNYEQASKNDCWKNFICENIVALKDNNTWIITNLLPNKSAIECCWVYKIKYKVEILFNDIKFALLLRTTLN